MMKQAKQWAGWTLLTLVSCGTAGRESAFTELRGGACREEVDRADPNETKYWACPGTGGYSLRVRQVEAGRQSVDVVDAAGKVMPLGFQDKVTRGMNSLGDKAEWRVVGGKPVGMMVKVEAREDLGDPEKVTRVIWAVAKVGSEGACVTELATEEEAGRRGADAAGGKACLGDLKP